MTDEIDNRNALPTGYRLENYEIQKVLGDGAFGITYLAKDTQLDTQVAIKEYLPNELAVRESNYTVHVKSKKDANNFKWALDRFLDEARTLAQFKHHNIVRVLRFFEANNTAYIVMEYEHGQSLASIIKDGETPTEDELMMLLPPLLEGLKKVHELGYLHRDIKPANIYLRDKDKSLVLIDFGSARYDVGSRSRTVTAIVTEGYAPYEQYETQGNRQGAWTDIYAFGAVLYRLISGKPPVESLARIGAMIRGEIDPLTPAVEIGSGRYSQNLLESIDWALKVKEKDRPQSVDKWCEKLLGKAAPIPPQSEEPNSVVVPTTLIKPEPVANSGFLKWGLIGVGVLLLSVIIIVAGSFISKSKPVENNDNKLADTEQALRIAELEKKIELAKLEAKKARQEREAVERAKKALQREAEEKAKKERLKREAEEKQPLPPEPIPVVPPEPDNNQQEEEERRHKQAAIDLVRGYYQDLDNNDKYSASNKWIKPSEATIAGMTGNEFFRVNSAKITSYSSYYASVYVDVSGKKSCCRAENWRLTLLLKNVSGDWKIVKFKNGYKY